jgi:hypothetical protein
LIGLSLQSSSALERNHITIKRKETAMANEYSIQIKCFQTIDVDGIEDKPELFGDPISGGFTLKSKVVLLWVVIPKANWKPLLSISMLLNLIKRPAPSFSAIC